MLNSNICRTLNLILRYYTSLRENSLGLLILQLYLYPTIRSGSTGADCPMTRHSHMQCC